MAEEEQRKSREGKLTFLVISRMTPSQSTELITPSGRYLIENGRVSKAIRINDFKEYEKVVKQRFTEMANESLAFFPSEYRVQFQ